MSINTNYLLFTITIFVILASNIQYSSGLRILGIFPVNGKSHFVMCERLMKGLAERGHQVDVYSHFPLKSSIPNYKDFSLAGTIPNIVNNVTYEHIKDFRTPSMKRILEFSNPICELMDLPIFQNLFKSLKKDQPYDIVILEVFISDCYLAWGRYIDIPMIGVMTSTLIDWYNEPLGNPLNTAVIPGAWSEFTFPMNFWERLSNTVMYYTMVTTYEYYIRDENKYIKQFFGPDYPDITELKKDIDLLLVNTHHSIDGIRAYTPAIIPLAGLHIEDDKTKLPEDVQKWLDESKAGCIYVSFGSMVRIETFPKPVLDAFYATFKNIAPVRVLMKVAKPQELPIGLPSNVMTQSWFSQFQVLKHKNIKAFVTHGGLMSTLESIQAGVPLVGIPLFGDQHLNIKKQIRKKTATSVELGDITKETLISAVKTVLNDGIYNKNIKKLSKEMNDRPMDLMDEAAYWIEYIARHGKKALRSPIVDIPWWQANLIDVYGFILFILIAAYYVLKLVFKGVKSFCYSINRKTQPKKVKKN